MVGRVWNCILCTLAVIYAPNQAMVGVGVGLLRQATTTFPFCLHFSRLKIRQRTDKWLAARNNDKAWDVITKMAPFPYSEPPGSKLKIIKLGNLRKLLLVRSSFNSLKLASFLKPWAACFKKRMNILFDGFQKSVQVSSNKLVLLKVS